MNPCETCAFGKNGKSGASSEPKNRLTAIISANAGLPFFCHHRRDGGDWEWHSDTAVAEFLKLPPTAKKLCEGWRREVARRKAIGHFNVGDTPEDQALLRRYQRGLGADALKTLNNFLTEKDPADRKDLLFALKDLCRALAPQRKEKP